MQHQQFTKPETVIFKRIAIFIFINNSAALMILIILLLVN
jgi:hypothetical protein